MKYKDVIRNNGLYILNDTNAAAFTYSIISRPGQPGSIVDHLMTDDLSKTYNASIHDNAICDHRYLIRSVRSEARKTQPMAYEYIDLKNAISLKRKFIKGRRSRL